MEFTYYPKFQNDVERWSSSDQSLGEEIVKKCKSIEENPFKGESKPGGPIAGCRSVYLRDQTYAIIYDLVPDPCDPSKEDQIDEIKFLGVTKHDNQDRARSGTESAPITMVSFEAEIPGEESGRIHSALKDTDGIYVYDDEIVWDDPATICGEYERRHEDQFESIISEGEIVETQQRSPEDFLHDP